MEPNSLRLDPRVQRHAQFISSKLPLRNKYGYWELHSLIIPPTNLPDERPQSTFLDPSKTYSETLRYSLPPETHPDGYTRIYVVGKGGPNPTTSEATTCYYNGYIVSEGYIDYFCEEDTGFNPTWFTYTLQRHLQLSREVFESYTQSLNLLVGFSSLDRFEWEIYAAGKIVKRMKYAGYHHDIELVVPLLEISPRDRWNVLFPSVEKIMLQVARIFGMQDLPQRYWNEQGELDYSRSIPGR